MHVIGSYLRSSLLLSSMFVAVSFALGGCAAAPVESSDSSANALVACECSSDDIDGEDITLDDDGANSPGPEMMLNDFTSPNGGVQLRDIVQWVGEIKVQIPQLKGDRCHAGDVHLTVTDSNGNIYKMKPTAKGWVTVDGRPGPSSRIWDKISKNGNVARALSKLTKAAGFCASAFILVGYDNYVSAGEQAGYTILDKIKTMRTMQDICKDDENGVMRPTLPPEGVIPGGIGSGRDLHWEVIPGPNGPLYTSWYYESDCTWLESRFGCAAEKKHWLVKPEDGMLVPDRCLLPRSAL